MKADAGDLCSWGLFYTSMFADEAHIILTYGVRLAVGRNRYRRLGWGWSSGFLFALVLRCGYIHSVICVVVMPSFDSVASLSVLPISHQRLLPESRKKRRRLLLRMFSKEERLTGTSLQPNIPEIAWVNLRGMLL